MDVHGGPGNRKRRKSLDPEWIKFMTEEEKETHRINRWCNVSVSDAGLPMRISNMLESHDIMTVGDLAEATAEELQKIHNFGELTINKCVDFLEKLGLPNKLNKAKGFEDASG